MSTCVYWCVFVGCVKYLEILRQTVPAGFDAVDFMNQHSIPEFLLFFSPIHQKFVIQWIHTRWVIMLILWLPKLKCPTPHRSSVLLLSLMSLGKNRPNSAGFHVCENSTIRTSSPSSAVVSVVFWKNHSSSPTQAIASVYRLVFPLPLKMLAIP